MQSLALSKCRSGASDYGQGMTQSLPLSYWSPEKSYMTSSRMTTKIYIAARFRVNLNRPTLSRRRLLRFYITLCTQHRTVPKCEEQTN
jgi:hypothetical protein